MFKIKIFYVVIKVVNKLLSEMTHKRLVEYKVPFGRDTLVYLYDFIFNHIRHPFVSN